MDIQLLRRRRLPNGQIETFVPMRNADGYFILADRAVDTQHNKAVNQFYVKDIRAVAARIRRGGVSLRMQGDITKQPNLISASEIEIIVVDSSKPGVGDDPFASFSEWSDEADEKAYEKL